MTTISSSYIYSRSISLADDATTTLPSLNNNALGWISIGTSPECTKFAVGGTGVVTLIFNTDNVTSNADTDGYLCIGTAAQNPLIIKNRLGSSETINIFILYG